MGCLHVPKSVPHWNVRNTPAVIGEYYFEERVQTPELADAGLSFLSPSSGWTMADMECPLCYGSFPNDKIEAHASRCTGELPLPPQTGERPNVDFF